MGKTLKIPLQLREAEVCTLETRKEGKATRISFALSSEHPVERIFGMEILAHDERSIRLDRLNRRAMPLLFNHNADDPIGMVDSGGVRDGRLVVDATMFDTERAREVEAMLAGGLRNVSVGYRIHDAEEDRKSGQVRVTDWEPYEASIVTIPADPTVGLGRSGEQEFDVEIRSTETAQTAEETAMTDQVNATAGASAEVRDSASIERLRIQTIHKLAEQHKVPAAEREAWISEGVSVDDVGRKVLDIIAERGSRNPETSVAAIGMSKNEAQRYSMFKAVRAVLDKNWTKAGLEFEAHKEIAKRVSTPTNENTFYVPLEVQQRPVKTRANDLSVAAQGGGYLVESSNQGFIELLRNNSVAFRAGATRLSGLVGNVNIPKQSAAATAYWLAAETTQITDSVQTLVQVPLTPKTVGAYTEISRLLLLQSSPDAEGLVMADLAQVTAIAMDKAALHGAGGSGEPQGIVGSANVGSVTCTSIGTDTYKKMLEFQVDLAAANALRGSLAYVTTPTVAGLLANYPRFASTDTPVWDGNILNASMCGLPAFTSNQLEAGYCIFGNWADLIVGEWGVLAVEANPYANFQAGIVGIRAMYTVDIALRHGASFSVTTSVAA
jgi:HK97 family phage major capsid protein/HK97 family phage prohead protease